MAGPASCSWLPRILTIRLRGWQVSPLGLEGSVASFGRTGKDPAFEGETEQSGPEFDRIDVPGPDRTPERSCGRVREPQAGDAGVVRKHERSLDRAAERQSSVPTGEGGPGPR
jgi:hypothetical protein